MLALSIVSPHGCNIANGRKTLEVRSWKPDVLPLKDLLIIENEVMLLEEGQFDPSGRAVAVVDISEVHPWEKNEVDAACSKGWELGYWAWTIVNVRTIQHNSPLIAKHKLYELNFDASLFL